MRKIICTIILLAFILTACRPTHNDDNEVYSDETTIITAEVKDVLSADTTVSISPQIQTLHSQNYKYSEYEIIMLSKLVWKEAGACEPSEQRLVVWTVFQRIDSTDYDFKDMNTIYDTVTASGQFAYDPDTPIHEDILNLCKEEATKWADNKPPPTMDPYAPTLPYLFYSGDGSHNWFRAEWQ